MYYTANHTGAASCMQQDYTHYYAEKTTIIYHYHGVFLSWYNKEKKKRKSQSQGFGRPKKWPFYCVYSLYTTPKKVHSSSCLHHCCSYVMFFYSKRALRCYFFIMWRYKGSHSTSLLSPTEKRIKVMPSPTSAYYSIS